MNFWQLQALLYGIAMLMAKGFANYPSPVALFEGKIAKAMQNNFARIVKGFQYNNGLKKSRANGTDSGRQMIGLGSRLDPATFLREAKKCSSTQELRLQELFDREWTISFGVVSPRFPKFKRGIDKGLYWRREDLPAMLERLSLGLEVQHELMGELKKILGEAYLVCFAEATCGESRKSWRMTDNRKQWATSCVINSHLNVLVATKAPVSAENLQTLIYEAHSKIWLERLNAGKAPWLEPYRDKILAGQSDGIGLFATLKSPEQISKALEYPWHFKKTIGADDNETAGEGTKALVASAVTEAAGAYLKVSRAAKGSRVHRTYPEVLRAWGKSKNPGLYLMVMVNAWLMCGRRQVWNSRFPKDFFKAQGKKSQAVSDLETARRQRARINRALTNLNSKRCKSEAEMADLIAAGIWLRRGIFERASLKAGRVRSIEDLRAMQNAKCIVDAVNQGINPLPLLATGDYLAARPYIYRDENYKLVAAGSGMWLVSTMPELIWIANCRRIINEVVDQLWIDRVWVQMTTLVSGGPIPEDDLRTAVRAMIPHAVAI